MQKKIIISLLVIAAITVIAAVGISLDDRIAELTEEGTLSNINVNPGHVRIYKNGELVAEQNNVLMRGHEAIREQLVDSDTTETGAWDHIALADDEGDTPGLGDETLEGKYVDCGLESQEADLTKVEGDYDGEWELVATFTYDSAPEECDDEALVETTAQRNPDLDGGQGEPEYFAGTDFDRVIELHDGDELTVEWINEVQDA